MEVSVVFTCIVQNAAKIIIHYSALYNCDDIKRRCWKIAGEKRSLKLIHTIIVVENTEAGKLSLC